MQLDELMVLVSEAYDGDGAVLRHHQSKDAVGDGLAEFVANEISETYVQDSGRLSILIEAKRVMYIAQNQLTDVIAAIEEQEKKCTREVHIKATLPEDRELLRRQKETFGEIITEVLHGNDSSRKEGKET